MIVPPQLAGKYQGEEQDEHRRRQGAAIFFRARLPMAASVSLLLTKAQLGTTGAQLASCKTLGRAAPAKRTIYVAL